MYPDELIGRNVIRTKPVQGTEDGWGYCTNAMKILAATETHIVAERNRYKFILDSRFIDENWIDYDELMKLADTEHINIMKQILT